MLARRRFFPMRRSVSEPVDDAIAAWDYFSKKPVYREGQGQLNKAESLIAEGWGYLEKSDCGGARMCYSLASRAIRFVADRENVTERLGELDDAIFKAAGPKPTEHA